MDETAYILTYRDDGGGDGRDNLLAVVHGLGRTPLLEVIPADSR